MVNVPTQDEIKKRYDAGAGRAPAAYAEAVKKTTGVIEAAKKGEDLYAQKMTQVIAEKRRLKGLEKTTDEDWRRGAIDKGAKRIGPGMKAAVDKQAKGFEPYRQLLGDIELPPRAATGEENIENRLKPIALGMEAKKKELLG